MRYLVLTALLVSLPVASHACINDRDSDALAAQNKRLPDALRVISGRFERNPPRYFEMRVERVEKELKANPRQFALYDDLAVAHDRLGDDVAAMKVMAQKRALLPKYNASDKANREAWYRYYANDGTFRAHRFLHEGAKVERLAEMKHARDEIARALLIKPDAHFGRERYQLLVMEWIIARKIKKTQSSLASYLDNRLGWEEDYSEGGPTPIGMERAPLPKQRQEAAEGLSGLIVLGAAWQSPDVFDALGTALQMRSTIALSHLAYLRRDELQTGQAKPAPGPTTEDETYIEESALGLNEKNAKTLDEFYPRLRAEGDEWIRQRDQWMLAKFKLGQHPDTHPQFWVGWKEPSSSNLEQVKWWNDRQQRYENDPVPTKPTLWVLAPIFGSLGVSLWLLKRKWRGRRKTALA